MSAIEPGTDLSCVGWKFLRWILTDVKVNPGINHPLVRGVIKQCVEIIVPLTKGLPVDMLAVKSADWSAARAAEWGVVWRAEWSAGSGRSAKSVRCAVNAANAAWNAANAAWNAANAARAAESAAWSAKSAARSAENVASAKSAAYIRMSDKLITLIKAAPRLKVPATLIPGALD